MISICSIYFLITIILAPKFCCSSQSTSYSYTNAINIWEENKIYFEESYLQYRSEHLLSVLQKTTRKDDIVTSPRKHNLHEVYIFVYLFLWDAFSPVLLFVFLSSCCSQRNAQLYPFPGQHYPMLKITASPL